MSEIDVKYHDPDWALRAAKEYTDLKENVLSARIDAIEQAVAKAECQLNKRLEGMNEFREEIKDHAARLLTRAEYEVAHRAVESELRKLELARSNQEGRESKNAILLSLTVSVIIGVIMLVIGHVFGKP